MPISQEILYTLFCNSRFYYIYIFSNYDSNIRYIWHRYITISTSISLMTVVTS